MCTNVSIKIHGFGVVLNSNTLDLYHTSLELKSLNCWKGGEEFSFYISLDCLLKNEKLKLNQCSSAITQRRHGGFWSLSQELWNSKNRRTVPISQSQSSSPPNSFTWGKPFTVYTETVITSNPLALFGLWANFTNQLSRITLWSCVFTVSGSLCWRTEICQVFI